MELSIKARLLGVCAQVMLDGSMPPIALPVVRGLYLAASSDLPPLDNDIKVRVAKHACGATSAVQHTIVCISSSSSMVYITTPSLQMQVLRHVLHATGQGAPSRSVAGGLADDEAVALVRPLLHPISWLEEGQLLTWFLALRCVLWWAPCNRPGVVIGVLDGFDVASFLAAANAVGLLDLRASVGELHRGAIPTMRVLPAAPAMMEVPAELGGSSASGIASASATRPQAAAPLSMATASPLVERLLSLAALGWAKQGADGVCTQLLQGVVGTAPGTYFAAAVGIACRHPVPGVRAAMLRMLSTIPQDTIPLPALAEAAGQLARALEAGWMDSADVPMALQEQLFTAGSVWEAVECVHGGRQAATMTSPCMTLHAASTAGT